MFISTSRLPIALLLIAGCKPDCPNGVTDRNGYNCTPFGEETGVGSSSSGDISSTTTEGESSSTGDDTSTTEVQPCDDDPICGPDESVESCPEQCGICGDGFVSGIEICDNGSDNLSYWPQMPPAGACSEACTLDVEWCGDAKPNGTEACDNGTNDDEPYSPMPAVGACSIGCVVPQTCGDGEKNGPEACDDAAQTASCELNCSLPVCGDGTHNPLSGEACDDSNTADGDGCTGDCKAIERFVFVSSTTWEGDLGKNADNPQALAGLMLADARCQTLAVNAGLSGNFRAWLSTSDTSPSDRYDTRFQGLYRLRSANTPIVANGWAGLTSGTLLHAIDSDENGAAVVNGKNVWTNTLPDGTSASDLHCNGWQDTDKMDNKVSTVGLSSASDSEWTNSAPGQLCSGANRLYCFQDP